MPKRQTGNRVLWFHLQDSILRHGQNEIDRLIADRFGDDIAIRKTQCVKRRDLLAFPAIDFIAVPQAEDSLAALRAAVAGLDDFALTALHNLTVTCGSLVLALAVAEGRVDAVTAWSLSRLDEDWQAGIWGEDPEAARRAAVLKAEVETTAAVLAAEGAAPGRRSG